MPDEETIGEKRSRAMTNALLASRLLDDAVYEDMRNAVINNDANAFHDICKKQGIKTAEIRNKLWQLCRYEWGNQPAGVCW